MHSIAAASQAIVALNGLCPPSPPGEFSAAPLLVRFADSPEEKARKQARRDQDLFRQNRWNVDGNHDARPWLSPPHLRMCLTLHDLVPQMHLAHDLLKLQ